MAVAAVVALNAMRFSGDDAAPRSGSTDLVAGVRAGDPQAFRTLFERWAPPVRRFLAGMLRDRAAADEPTQECFVRAHRQIGGQRDDTGFDGWLFGIARLVAMDQRRAPRRATDLPAAAEPA